MKIQVVLSGDGMILSYATVGAITGSVEIDIPDETDLSILDHARWDGEQLLEITPEPTSTPSATVEERLEQVEEAMAMLAYGGTV